MSILYQAMQRMVRDYDENKTGTGVLFGRVVCESPLAVEIDAKVVLPERFLTVSQHLTDYEIPYEILSPERAEHPEKLPTKYTRIREIEGFYVEHEGRRDVQVDQGVLGNFDGTGTIKLRNHLREGERVILLRMDGGHQYVVVDRVAAER